MRVFAVPRSIARSFENRPCSQSKIIARSGLLAPRQRALDSLGNVLERRYVRGGGVGGQPLLAQGRLVSTLGPYPRPSGGQAGALALGPIAVRGNSGLAPGEWEGDS